MQKTMNIDLNLEEVDPRALEKQPSDEEKKAYNEAMAEWVKNKNQGPQPELVREYYTGPEVFENFVLNAMQNVYPHAEKIVLFRCGKIHDAIKEAIVSTHHNMVIEEDDLKFLRKCIDKCKWANNVQNRILLRSMDRAFASVN